MRSSQGGMVACLSQGKRALWDLSSAMTRKKEKAAIGDSSVLESWTVLFSQGNTKNATAVEIWSGKHQYYRLPGAMSDVLGHLPGQNVPLPMAVGTESAKERNPMNFQRL